jgi:hypothetical protein
MKPFTEGFFLVSWPFFGVSALMRHTAASSSDRLDKPASWRRLCPIGLPLFNREYADYTSSVHDPSGGFRWFPLSHERSQDYELR